MYYENSHKSDYYFFLKLLHNREESLSNFKGTQIAQLKPSRTKIFASRNESCGLINKKI